MLQHHPSTTRPRLWEGGGKSSRLRPLLQGRRDARVSALRGRRPCIIAIRRHPQAMHLDSPEPTLDPAAQRRHDRGRLARALKASLAFVLLLVVVFSAQQALVWRPFAVIPHTATGRSEEHTSELQSLMRT